MKRAVLLASLFVALSARVAEAAPQAELRVGLFRYHPPQSVQVLAAGAWRASAAGTTVSVAGGRTAAVSANGEHVELKLGGHVVAAGPRLALATDAVLTLSAAGVPARRYAGSLAFTARSGTLTPVLTLPLEDYVGATTGDEMPADWPFEALAAQGIASRSYASALQGRHGNDGFDFCDLTHCQLFHGLSTHDARVLSAVRATRGRVIGYHGRAIAALWHSTCAGTRESNDAIFGGEPLPYLQGGPDRTPHGEAWCAASPHAHPWLMRYDHSEVTRALAREHVLSRGEGLSALSVADAKPDGLALAVRVEGARVRTLSGYGLWMALGPHFGWGEIKSPRFSLTREGQRYAFSGSGLGHLVGMCQWGARGRALAGWRWGAIVAAYFPGTTILREH